LSRSAGQEQQLVHGLLILNYSDPVEVRAPFIQGIQPVQYLPRLQLLIVVELDNNEAAFSLAIAPFSAKGGELHLVVGTAADTLVSPRACEIRVSSDLHIH